MEQWIIRRGTQTGSEAWNSRQGSECRTAGPLSHSLAIASASYHVLFSPTVSKLAPANPVRDAESQQPKITTRWASRRLATQLRMNHNLTMPRWILAREVKLQIST